jgi:ketosteroid isomerase-like protein
MDHDNIRSLLQRINAAWLHGETDNLLDLFHDNMVIAVPGSTERAEGKQVCAASYRDFRQQATILAYQEADPEINVWGDTAVATYRYVMDYEIGGDLQHDHGQDVFVFARGPEGWRAVWRTLVPLPE